jgi:adenylate cyclase
VDEPTPTPEAIWTALRRKLAELGVGDDAFAKAAERGLDDLALLVARHVSFPGERRYTPRMVYETAGTTEETARALWRAMGFPEVPDDEAAFTDADIEAVRVATRLFDRAAMDETIVLQQARAMGQATARIAASHQDVIGEVIPTDDPVEAAREVISLAEEVLPSIDHLLAYMYRRHLAAAVEQRMLQRPTPEGGVDMSVGFADMTGFTALSQELEVHGLAQLIDRFNGATSNVVAAGGGRIVKTIGDEVMFASLEPGSAAGIAVSLLEEVSGVDGLPPLRVGVATGLVVAREGDIFGPPANAASRLVAMAVPGSALVDDATKRALDGDPRFRFSSLGRRPLKGIGPVRLHRLRPAEPDR